MNKFEKMKENVEIELFELTMKYSGYELYSKTKILINKHVQEQVQFSNWERQKFQTNMVNFVNNGDLTGERRYRCLKQIHKEDSLIYNVATDYDLELM